MTDGGVKEKPFLTREELEGRIAVLEQQLRDAQEVNAALVKRIDAALALTDAYCRNERRAA